MPMLSANFSMFSKNDRGWRTQSGTVIARTHLLQNGLKLEPTNRSDRSTISSGFRRSGLSVPYFNMLSLYVMRGNGAFVTVLPPPNFSNTAPRTVSAIANTSSCVANAISKSSW